MPWVMRGLRDSVVTTGYPRRDDPAIRRGVTAVARPAEGARWSEEFAGMCPTDAIGHIGNRVTVDQGACIGCGRCVARGGGAFIWEDGPGRPSLTRAGLVVPAEPETDAAIARVRAALAQRTRALRQSVHIRHVDAGSDGSTEWEVLALTNPVYDVHRLGIFFTASPRHADLLLVTGVGTPGMAAPLARTLDATPRPVVVIAAGADAASGCLTGQGHMPAGGIADLIDVDVWVPGSPPTPFALLQGILLALGRLPAPPGREQNAG